MTDQTEVLGANAQQLLRSYARRLNVLLDQQDEVRDDTKELMKEVKNDGLTPKLLRETVKRMRQDAAKRAEEEAIIDLYTHAIQGELFDESRVTIEIPGKPPIETTPGAMKRAAERLAG